MRSFAGIFGWQVRFRVQNNAYSMQGAIRSPKSQAHSGFHAVGWVGNLKLLV
jgi:hypothetical protein